MQAPMAARKFKPGQFYRLQNFESLAPVVEGTRLGMEGLALTGAWIDEEKGLLGTIVLEMGGSSRLCAALQPGEPIVAHGPDRHAHPRSPKNETVLLVRRRPRQRRALLDRARAEGARQRGPLLRRLQEGRRPLQAGRHRGVHRPGHLVHGHGRGDRAAPPAGRALPRQHRPGDGRLRRRASSASGRSSCRRSIASSRSAPTA